MYINLSVYQAVNSLKQYRGVLEPQIWAGLDTGYFSVHDFLPLMQSSEWNVHMIWFKSKSVSLPASNHYEGIHAGMKLRLNKDEKEREVDHVVRFTAQKDASYRIRLVDCLILANCV